jgi:hydroxymethylglutaryl-CoA lyase
MESVKLIECPRDAWQGLEKQIPTERKVAYLNGLIAGGFRHIDAVSFVSPKAVPQMADSEEVLQRLKPPGDVEIIGIVVNEKGAERAISTGAVTTLGYPCSVSETFLRRNQNQSAGENMGALKQIKQRAQTGGLQTNAYISMAFGNPYGDAWSEMKVAEMAKTLLGLGVEAISLADTVGAAAPELISRLVAAVLGECSGAEVGVHLHSTRGDAAAKILAAYDAGCRRFDSAMGGLGGCPFAQDELVGNVPTEEVLQALETRGIKLSIADGLRGVTSLNGLIGAEFGTA